MSHIHPPLPLKNGVAASFINLPHGRGLLLDFLCAQFPHARRETWLERMARGEVVSAQGEILHHNSLCAGLRTVFYYKDVPNETPIPFVEEILFQDDCLVVVDKPHFLPVIPTGEFVHHTVLTRLRQRLDCPHLSPIHRLDKDTAGVLLFSRNQTQRGAYQTLFTQQRVHKIYHAIARTRTDLTYPLHYSSRLVDDSVQFFKMQQVAGAANSHTSITRLDTRGALSLYQLEPHTGKKHQLRAHMNALDMPIINDALYPTAQPAHTVDFNKPLQLLAKSIAFTDPITGQARCFVSPRELHWA
ncbi:MAG: pseudouridine synthase [Formosimonas sp.]